jgi:hypothetical protein
VKINVIDYEGKINVIDYEGCELHTDKMKINVIDYEGKRIVFF